MKNWFSRYLVLSKLKLNQIQMSDKFSWACNGFPFFDFSFKPIQRFLIFNFRRYLLQNLCSQMRCFSSAINNTNTYKRYNVMNIINTSLNISEDISLAIYTIQQQVRVHCCIYYSPNQDLFMVVPQGSTQGPFFVYTYTCPFIFCVIVNLT